MACNIEFRTACGSKDINTISGIATYVMHETFDALTPEGQSDYMINKFLTPAAIEENISTHGYIYKLIIQGGNEVGFFAYCPARDYDPSRACGTFLSKLYLMPAARGQGITKMVVSTLARPIILTVKRDNARAVEVYKHNGFKVAGYPDVDIGGGYRMVDYLMELE